MLKVKLNPVNKIGYKTYFDFVRIFDYYFNFRDSLRIREY